MINTSYQNLYHTKVKVRKGLINKYYQYFWLQIIYKDVFIKPGFNPAKH